MAAPSKKREQGLVRRPSLFAERWDDMENAFGRMFDDFWRRPRFSFPEMWAPRSSAVDVYEDKNDVVVKAEMPGLEKADIDVNLTETTLTIRGEKKKEEEVKEDDYYRSERAYGMVSRTVDLPAEVESGKAKATFKNGVLEVRIPKSKEAASKSRKIQIG